MNELSEADDPSGDGEGVWSPDIEYYFHEALELFPQCGRRKTILQEEGGGKMYGRNELIARHILIKTGKVRTRKQVSSHIQVLARRKVKSEAPSNSGGGSTAGSVSPASSSMDVAGDGCGAARTCRLDSANSLDSGAIQHQHQITQNQPQRQSQQQQQQQPQHPQPRPMAAIAVGCFYDIWNDRPVVTQKIRLVEFSAFIEHRRTTTGTTGGPVFATNPLGGLTSLASAAVASPAPVSLSRAHVTPRLSLPDTNLINHVPSLDVVEAPPVTLAPSSAHPLASNHHLSAQTNHATDYHHHHHNHLHQSVHSYLLHNDNNNNNQLQVSHSNQGVGFIATAMPVNMHGSQLLSIQQQQQQQHQQPLHQPSQPSTGLTRHSYVKIDHKQLLNAHASKLERIDIGQIQDKFPEIGGTGGLFQQSCSDAFFLVKFWADLHNDFEYNIEDQNSYFGFSSHFETIDRYDSITCSTKACSYGNQVVEKVDKIHSTFNNSNGRYSYEMNRSPMCEFMIQFIKKLRQLPRATQMNSVLENFTVLQVVTNESTSEILICLAYVFEIASPEQNRGGSQYHVYKLTRN